MSSEHKKSPKGESYCEALHAVFQDFSEEKLASVRELFLPQVRRAQERVLLPDRLSEHSVLLSSRERHLLAVHRSELASLMLDACLRLLLEHETLGGYVVPSTPQDCELKPQTPTAWRERATKTRAVLPDPVGLDEPLALMNALMSVGGRKPDLLDVAQAGLSIAPSSTLRRYCALGYIGRGELEVAEKILKKMLVPSVQVEERTKAACVLSHISFLRRDSVQGVEWSRMGATSAEPIPTSILNWFVHAVQLGAGDEAARAAALMSDFYSESSESLEGFCRILMTDRLAGTWRPSPGARKYLQQSHSGLPSYATRILNALR